MASVEERVKQIIVEQLGVDEAEVTPTASFVDDLGADSLDTVESSWHSKRPSKSRFLTKTPKKFAPCKTPSRISISTPRRKSSSQSVPYFRPRPGRGLWNSLKGI